MRSKPSLVLFQKHEYSKFGCSPLWHGDIWSRQTRDHFPPKMGIISSRISVSDVNFLQNGRSTAVVERLTTGFHLSQKHSSGFLLPVKNSLSDSFSLLSVKQQNNQLEKTLIVLWGGVKKRNCNWKLSKYFQVQFLLFYMYLVLTFSKMANTWMLVLAASISRIKPFKTLCKR